MPGNPSNRFPVSSLKTSFFAVLASVALTSGFFHFSHQHRRQEANRLRDANSRLRFEASQHQQRQTAATVSGAKDEPAGGPVKPPTARPAPIPAPTGDYRNEGQLTPLATLQTFAWTCDRGDTQAVAKLLFFDRESRDKATAFMATLPEKVRAQWQSPEEMAAALLTAEYMNHPFPGAMILEKATTTQVRADRVRLLLPGTGSLKENTEYQRKDGVWEYVITEAMVDDYVSQAAPVPAGG